MVNRVKKTERQKNPEGNTSIQNIYAWGKKPDREKNPVLTIKIRSKKKTRFWTIKIRSPYPEFVLN